MDNKWPDGDWRNTFLPENLKSSLEHAEGLRAHIPSGIPMAEMASRFILNNPTISTIIPGIRKLRHIESNLACSDAGPLPEVLHTELRKHSWDCTPTEWSQ